MVNAGNHDVNEDPDRVTVGGQETGLTTLSFSFYVKTYQVSSTNPKKIGNGLGRDLLFVLDKGRVFHGNRDAIFPIRRTKNYQIG